MSLFKTSNVVFISKEITNNFHGKVHTHETRVVHVISNMTVLLFFRRSTIREKELTVDTSFFERFTNLWYLRLNESDVLVHMMNNTC